MNPYFRRFILHLARAFCCRLIITAMAMASSEAAPWEAQLRNLQKAVNLTPSQVQEVQRAFKAFESQAVMDRETLKGDMDGLVAAYDRRTPLSDQAVLDALTEAQRPLFELWREHRDARRDLIRLQEGLVLSPAQAAQAAALDARLEERAAADRATQGSKASDLIKAAQKRREDRDKAIKKILNDDQRTAFKHYLKQWKNDPLEQELFRLREGVLLTDAQSDAVRKILEEHANEESPEHGRIDRSTENGSEGSAEDGEERGGGRGRGGSHRGGPISGDRMRPRDKEILELLDDQQKILFDQLMKEQMEKTRGQRGGHGHGMGRTGPGGSEGRPPGGY
jgi:hypothetical protein